MGWWKIKNTEHLLGDEPLDALNDAVRRVVAAYERDFGRKPLRAEWRAMLEAALIDEADRRATSDSPIVRVTLDPA